jgi:threonylcarbamoyladenosine tRNA methylthiotransferase MtaB
MIRRQIKSSKAKVIVTGCLATIEKEKMLATPGIDGVITQSEKTKLLESDFLLYNELTASYLRPMRSRPMIKIQDGCPNECSYCIARIIRGKPKSVTPQKIISEIDQLTNLGYQEIVLTGLNLGYYGRDIGACLANLLDLLPNKNYRVRLSSIEPDTITDELLAVCYRLMTNGKLCRHLHIPLQSGDYRILKMMRRQYSTDNYRKLIERIYTNIHGINIGTDVIVGFFEEDEHAFNKTLKLIEELPFGYLHVFPYSPRPGTESAKLSDTVKPEIKKERVHILREIGREKKLAFRERFTGHTMEVLIEENHSGVTDNYIRVNLAQDSNYHIARLYKLIV